MKWHQKTARLLARNLSPHDAAAATLTAIERQRGFTFPESVREWYGLEGAVALLRRHSNDDEPLAVEALGRPFDRWYYGGPRDFVREGRLVFMIENQGVCQWAVDLTGEADPPVSVIVDPGPSDEWVRCARSFSEFVYTQVWDHPGWEFWSSAQLSSLEPAELDTLRERCREDVRTSGWPGQTTYRFASGPGRVLIWDSGERGTDWHLLAPTLPEFEQLVRSPAVPDAVRAELYSSSHEGQSVIDRCRPR